MAKEADGHLSHGEVLAQQPDDGLHHALIRTQFFAQLTALLEKHQASGHGSIFLTQKRCEECSSNKP